MRRTLFGALVLTGIAITLNAQQAQTGESDPSRKSTSPADQQSWSGALMDATCSVITAERLTTTKTSGSGSSDTRTGASSDGPLELRRSSSTSTPNRDTFNADEKYRNCMVKPATTAFAIHSQGKLLILDEASNQLIRERLSGDEFRDGMTDAKGQPKFMTVTLGGSMKGDRLIVSSITRRRN